MLRARAVRHLRRLRNATIAIVLGAIIISFVASMQHAIEIQRAYIGYLHSSEEYFIRSGPSARDITRRLMPNRPIAASYPVSRAGKNAIVDVYAFPVDAPDSGATRYDLVQVVEAGWPRRSWYGYRLITSVHCRDATGEFQFFEFRVLPLRPIWRMLLLSIVEIAIIPLLLFELVWITLDSMRAAANHKRQRIGLCPMCRYDLRGDLVRGCPECGWARELQNESPIVANSGRAVP